ncbi:MAG: hypothetical protein SGI92_27280 [Bryobacteraceae bacterium]|nr:hypothetical protein [Bryobacteraceae bacterium]
MSQGALTGAVFPALLHQDPRYFRLGPKHSIWKQVGYSMSRVAVIRTDGGRQAPNWSFFLGTAAGVAMSNLWYPSTDRTGSVMGSRMVAISIGSATGNLLPEFWPDIQSRVLPRVLPYILLRIHKRTRAFAPTVVPASN